MLKYVAAIGLLLGASSIAFAQPGVAMAYQANKEGDYAAAAGYIDEALKNEKAATKEKTWRYRGDIYFNIALDSALTAQYPEAVKTSFESYTKATELAKNKQYTSDYERRIASLQTLALNNGVTHYNVGDYAGAARNFDMAKVIASSQGVVDSIAVFNSAIAFEKAGMYDEAVSSYKECISIGHMVPDVYQFASNTLKTKGDTLAAIEVVREGRKAFPRHQPLIIEELNYYLTRGEFGKAEENLRIAAEQDPTNEILFFSMGSVNDELGNSERAEEAYRKALEIQPDYFEANYNLGALYFNRGVEKVNEANEISDNTKYEAAMKEADGVFGQALPYLEKAHALQPEDMATVRSLKDIYVRVGNDDMFMEMNKKLKALTGQ